MQIEDIVKKEFSKSFMGYDIQQVDLFLDEIIDQIEKYEAERREMLTAMEYLLGELEQMEKVNTITSAPRELNENTLLLLGKRTGAEKSEAKSKGKEQGREKEAEAQKTLVAPVSEEIELDVSEPEPEDQQQSAGAGQFVHKKRIRKISLQEGEKTAPAADAEKKIGGAEEKKGRFHVKKV